jgi:hypothetical protein
MSGHEVNTDWLSSVVSLDKHTQNSWYPSRSFEALIDMLTFGFPRFADSFKFTLRCPDESPAANGVTLRRRGLIQGVFKKRPNFLKSSPTSTEGSLWLLSAPRGRFWQQTAICPVSLRALVVEIHLLNWARAQAVRRINQFRGCSSTTNSHSETGQMAVCCQNLPLCALSSRNAPSVLVGELFKKFGLFLNTHCIHTLIRTYSARGCCC